MSLVKNNPLTQYTDLPESELVFGFEEISNAIDRQAAILNKELAGQNPVVLCVMNGALVYTGHLFTRFTFNCELDYLHATRYRNTTQGDELEWQSYPNISLENRTVLILDDILDEGITLDAIKRYCYSSGASKVVMAVLLLKKHDRCCIEIDSDFVALEVKDKYVFGFGMDYEGQYRFLNSIYALRE